MKFDLSRDIDKARFNHRIEVLIKNESFVKLRKINPIRTNQQNKYLHLILGYFAIEYGETMEFVKEHFFKDVVNPMIFSVQYVNKKKGYNRPTWRSTADLDTGELTTAIERFRDYASKEADIYLPQPNEEEFLKYCEIEIDKRKQYL